jgi:hypothetical protein
MFRWFPVPSRFGRAGIAALILVPVLWVVTVSFDGSGSGGGEPDGLGPSSLELAMRSRVKDGLRIDYEEKVSGTITGVRLRETADGPEEYLVSLWSQAGVLLASAETGTTTKDQWFVATFPTPIPTKPDERYSVVYWASPRESQNGAARGDDVVVDWNADVVSTPTEDTGETSAPSASAEPTSAASKSAERATPISDIPLLPSYPNAANTGVPEGVTLKKHSGDWTITEPGTVIDGYDVSGIILVRANNVVIKNTRISGVGWWSVNISPGLTGVVVQDCDITGQGSSGRSNSMGIMGAARIFRNDIRGVENGIAPREGALVQDNYIHDLAAPGAPHYDGIQISGGDGNITLLHNTVLNPHPQTAAVFMKTDFGPIHNVRVENNYLGGGGYTVYAITGSKNYSIDGIRFIDNRLRRGHWGYASITNNDPVARGNVDAQSGASVSLAG